MEGREDILGFKPQKEIVYNKYLPYSSDIDSESNEELAQIKGNLAKSVQLRDLKIGCSHWTNQLMRYIRLYGRKFSKEDHICFIKLAFELITTPNLEPSLIVKFSSLLVTLLKKRDLLSRDDLVLPWRPLYKLCEEMLYSKHEEYGLLLLPVNVETTMKNVIKVCRVYFSEESTQEMLDEWRPLLCPYDIVMLKGMFYLEMFLPTMIPVEHHDKGYKLWFKEFVDLWDSCQNVPSWEANMVSLFARLAVENIGHIDWEPLIPKIFTRLLRSLNLPVGNKTVQVNHPNSGYETPTTAPWIIAMLGGGSSCQEHVEKLFKALETFYHPSNLGKWHTKLAKLMLRLPLQLCKRLNRERYKKETWQPKIPESHLLTDDDVTRFVECIKPVVFLGMFSKLGSSDACVTFHHLATLRPELIIPPLLEKMYPALETLTEPHRLTACLLCTTSTARSMLSNPKWYPEGPTHVLPLLNLTLPGLDPNDIRKTLVTFQMISTLVSLVPIVDCSAATYELDNLSEIEKELCSASAQFEDYVLQFMDRMFALIENSAHEPNSRMDTTTHSYKLSPEEQMLEIGLLSTFNSILQQSSTKIYKVALNKLFRFASSTVFELKVSGRLCADMCRAAAKTNPPEALKLFIPHCARVIKQLTENEDVQKEEHLDDELLWNMQMMSEVLRCNGLDILPYKEDIKVVLQRTIHLTCKQGYELSHVLLQHLLKALTMIYPLDFRSIPEDFSQPFKDYLPIRDWGKSADIHDLKMVWHTPSDSELEFVQELIDAILVPELQVMDSFVAGEPLSRDDLKARLGVILNIVIGAGNELPMIEGEAIHLIDSMVPLGRCSHICNIETSRLTAQGKHVRRRIAETMQPLLSHVLTNTEDDTKSLIHILKLYNVVMYFYGTDKSDFDGRWRSFQMVKTTTEDKLRGGKRHMRALIVDRCQLQHELRVVQKSNKSFTPLHLSLFEDLLRLSLSHYSEVRKQAQSVLSTGFHLFAYSYRKLLPEIMSHLKVKPDMDEEKAHVQFKGALYVLNGTKQRSLISKRNWEVMEQVWPELCQAQHSEKPSILKIIDEMADKIHKNAETCAVNIETSQSSIEAANAVFTCTSQPNPSVSSATQTEIEKGKQEEINRNTVHWIQEYLNLVETLISLINSGKLRWKFSEMSMELVSLMLRFDVRMPVNGVRLFMKNLISETLTVRKLCVSSVAAILQQQKQKFKKVEIDPYALSGTQRPLVTAPMRPGDRADNQWHVYNKDTVPTTKEDFDKTTLIHKTFWGYYAWPKHMYTYAPAAQQPSLDRKLEDLSEEEKPIFESFSDADYVAKFVHYLTLEDQKGRDKFNSKNFLLFKGLFRNFGDTFLPVYKPHVERLVADTAHDTHDYSQRVGAEIIAGLVRGSKNWPYEKVTAMWEWLCPVLRTALNNMTVETVEDWGTCFATMSQDRDPRQFHPLFELLMEDPLRGVGGSFNDASRLYVLQGVLAQQEWRVNQLLHRLLQYLQPYLTHAYKNVRDRLGSVLTSILMYDFHVPSGENLTAPKREEFIEQLMPSLTMLKDVQTTNTNNHQVKGDAPTSTKVGATPMEVDDVTVSDDISIVVAPALKPEDNEERKTAIKLFKTTLKWISGSMGRMLYTLPPDMLKFLPLICIYVQDTTDDELKAECQTALHLMAHTLQRTENVQHVLHVIKEISGLGIWRARTAVLTFIQAFVFYNLFTVLQTEHLDQIKDIVLHLLVDDQLEVREAAAVTLGGFLHCGYLKIDKQMLTHFEKLSSTKVKKQKRQQQVPISIESLIKRHAGILGLSALVQAYPYDVPEFMPQVLMDLSNHLDDPQPIQMTVKKTLSDFRRTHHDNWQDHKQKFTDDQLVVLTDLLVSPNYYA